MLKSKSDTNIQIS